MPKLADAMLTDQQIRRMPNPPIRVEKSDKNSGLYLIVQPSGAKSWAIRYRVERDGKLVQTRTTLGHYPGLGLADARTKARALREARADLWADVPAFAFDRCTPRRSRRDAMVGDQWQRVDDTGRAYQEQ